MIDERKFWSQVSLLDDSCDACWIWVGAFRDDGRGRFFQKGQEMRAHWAGWEIRFGEPVPEGSRLVQECKNPQCVRHWRLAGKFRKLSPAQVREIIKGTQGPKYAAKRYGVTPEHICRIRRTYVNEQTNTGRV